MLRSVLALRPQRSSGLRSSGLQARELRREGLRGADLLLLEGIDASPLLFELQLEANLLIFPLLDASILWPSGVLQFAAELLDDLVLLADLVPQLLH